MDAGTQTEAETTERVHRVTATAATSHVAVERSDRSSGGPPGAATDSTVTDSAADLPIPIIATITIAHDEAGGSSVATHNAENYHLAPCV